MIILNDFMFMILIYASVDALGTIKHYINFNWEIPRGNPKVLGFSRGNQSF